MPACLEINDERGMITNMIENNGSNDYSPGTGRSVKKKGSPWMDEVRNRVITTLESRDLLTRGQIAAETGIARTTIFDAIRPLVDQGIVHEFKRKMTTSKGRPRVLYSLVDHEQSMPPNPMEEKVTRVLTKRGTSTITEINELTGDSRSMIYHAIIRLERDGIVRISKNKRALTVTLVDD